MLKPALRSFEVTGPPTMGAATHVGRIPVLDSTGMGPITRGTSRDHRAQRDEGSSLPVPTVNVSAR